MTNLDKLRNAFATALGLGPETDFESLAYAVTPGWDSVAHLALVTEIEGAFDVMLSTDDVIGLSSFPVCRQILTTYGVGFA